MNQQPYALDVSLAELAAVLSRAADLAMGYPIERSLRVCLLAVHFGAALGMTDAALSDLYYRVLLRLVGCSAALLCDDPLHDTAPRLTASDGRESWQVLELLHVLRDMMHVGDWPIPLTHFVRHMLRAHVAREAWAVAAQCAAAQRMARRMDLRPQLLRRATLEERRAMLEEVLDVIYLTPHQAMAVRRVESYAPLLQAARLKIMGWWAGWASTLRNEPCLTKLCEQVKAPRRFRVAA